MTRLISVGNVIVDLVVRVPSLPEHGGDVLGRSGGSCPGGSANTLAAAVRQGLPSVYAGGHGTGPNGELVRAFLRAEGIRVVRPRSTHSDTGFDIALIDPDGERTFVTVFGAEAELEDMTAVDVAPGDYVHLSGYGLLERTNAGVLAPWAAEVSEGVVVLFDPGPLGGDIHPGVLAAVRARADWLSCSLREARLLSGESDATSAALALAGDWRAVIVRLGAEGCLVASSDRVDAVPGFEAAALDTNGAGDAHVGAFLAALAAGHPPLEAARRANACAAIAVTRAGPASAPTAAEVDRLLGCS